MARERCDGTRRPPVEARREESTGSWVASYEVDPATHSGVERITHVLVSDGEPLRVGLCPVCREVKRLLRDGTLATHTRWVTWKEQQARRSSPALST